MHPKNHHVVNSCKNIVLRKVIDLEELGSEEESMKKAEELIHAVEKVSHMLLSLLFLAGGMPGRGRESAFQTIQNSATGGQRSIFLYNGRVVLIPRYVKSEWTGSPKKFVSRFADVKTSDIFKSFMIFVFPLRCFLSHGMRKMKANWVENEASDIFLSRIAS